jgi:hypothetical protein
MLESQVGKVYGLLTVLADVESASKQRRVLVRCSCEAGTEKTTQLGNLRNGNTTSCGCVARAAAKARSTTHGLTQHPLYSTWVKMLQRCQNPSNLKYFSYGAKGITVCERWQKLENFLADMEPTHKEGLKLVRKDTAQGYNPENCWWATSAEQVRNRLRT